MIEHVAELRGGDHDNTISRRRSDDMAFWCRDTAPWAGRGVGPANQEVAPWRGSRIHRLRGAQGRYICRSGRQWAGRRSAACGHDREHAGRNRQASVQAGTATRYYRVLLRGRIVWLQRAASAGRNGSFVPVCAPSLTPRKPGERVKNDRRDAIALARLHRAGELTCVWLPDELHEALRDLVRARHAACQDVRRDRIRIQAFLLRYGLRYEGKPWSTRHRRWLWNRQFTHPAQQIAFQNASPASA